MKLAISILGTTLDARGARGEERWLTWRPNVALHMQEDIRFDKVCLLYDRRFRKLFETIKEDIEKVSPGTIVEGVRINFRDPWDFEEVYYKLYDYVCGKSFPQLAETDECYVHITTGTHVAQICLFLLTESHHLRGKLIQTFIKAPAETDDATLRARGEYKVIDLDLSRYDLIAQRFAVRRDSDVSFLKSGIETRNARFNHLIETIERAAIRSSEPIMLTGPTGAGKSQLARRIYALKKASGQLKGDFVEVNCATLRGDQALSTLFGHRKGAFTGALADRPGLLKAADGGMIFLDEIGELGIDEQAMLLRAIEDRRFFPLGSDREETSTFQVICGTNRQLDRACAEGRFRSDLLARLDLWTFALPGLAERREDIEPNLDYELRRFTEKTGKHITFNKEAHDRFLEFALSPTTKWSGNFRELNARVVRMATLSKDGRIDRETVEEELARTTHGAPSVQTTISSADLATLLGADYEQRFDPFDLVQLKHVLAVCRASSSLAEAGKQLFAVSRTMKKTGNDTDRLSKYLHRFGISAKQLL